MLAPSQKDSTYDTTVENSCKQIDAHEGPLMLDLDETLYLRNSTEDFIDTAVPGPLAWMMLKLLDVLKPWRFTGGWVTRDVWRVRMILLFFPWTMMRWRSRVQQLAERHGNRHGFSTSSTFSIIHANGPGTAVSMSLSETALT